MNVDLEKYEAYACTGGTRLNDRHRQSIQTGLPVGSVHEEAELPQRAYGH